MQVHVITPEGNEIVTTEAQWYEMPADWRSLAACLPCHDCPQHAGDKADHAAKSNHENIV